jgi:hypothetical protein
LQTNNKSVIGNPTADFCQVVPLPLLSLAPHSGRSTLHSVLQLCHSPTNYVPATHNISHGKDKRSPNTEVVPHSDQIMANQILHHTDVGDCVVFWSATLHSNLLKLQQSEKLFHEIYCKNWQLCILTCGILIRVEYHCSFSSAIGL